VKLVICAIGRLKAGPERTLIDRYGERAVPLARSLGFGGVDVVELSESRARRDDDRKREEAAAIRARLSAGPLIAFDERGKALTSEAFANQLAQWRDSGAGDISCVIGGPDGLDPALRAEAALTLSFGAMTLPHQIVRLLVAEQLYRAMTILAGHPYHRP
jgi:23S rRNA (pseudouridine1915-N3)-methyltransferase